MTRPGRIVIAALTLWIFGATAWAQQVCEPSSGSSLELVGLGVAYFGEFQFDSVADRAELYAGVCILSSGESSWQIEAERVEVDRITAAPSIKALEARLFLGPWLVTGPELVMGEGRLLMAGVQLIGAEVSGEAAVLSYDLESGAATFENLSVKTAGYRIAGSRASLQGDDLVFEDAVATTCVCEGSELYVVATPRATVDILEGRAMLQDGVLELGGIRIALAEELDLSEESFGEVGVPLELVFLEGSGMTLRIPRLKLAEALRLELGVSGLDAQHASRGIALFHISAPRVEATIGSSYLGPQADLYLSEPVYEHVEAFFELTNRYWAAADYTADAGLGLRANTRFDDLVSDDSLSVSASLRSSVSGQTVSGQSVLGPRLGLEAAAEYGLTAIAGGSLRLPFEASLTYYPRQDETQYSLRFRPGFKADYGPVHFSLGYDGQLSNGASPFSSSLDRRAPMSRAELVLGLAQSADSWSYRLAGNMRYNFLGRIVRDGSGAVISDSEYLERLNLAGQAELSTGPLRVQPFAELELAGLFEASADAAERAFVRSGFDLSYEGFGFGSEVDYNFFTDRVDLLEVRGSVALTAGNVELEPFVSLDLAPVWRSDGPFRLYGHGLELQWRSCCGTLSAGYRLHGDSVTTRLGFDLSR